MRTPLAILFFYFIACSSPKQQEKLTSTPTDTILFYKKIINRMQVSYDSLKWRKDTASQILAVKYKKLLDQSVLDQADLLKLVTITNNFYQLENEKTVLLSNFDRVQKNLIESQKSVQRFSDSLQMEKKRSKSVSIERNKLQAAINSANHISIVGTTIKSYGIRKPLLKDTLIYFETDKASKVKRVIVSFIVPENKLSGPSKLKFHVKIHGAPGIPEIRGLMDSVSITYNGRVEEISVPFNQKINWKASNHNVEILCNDQLLHTGNLILK